MIVNKMVKVITSQWRNLSNEFLKLLNRYQFSSKCSRKLLIIREIQKLHLKDNRLECAISYFFVKIYELMTS